MKVYLINELILLKGSSESHQAHKHYAIQVIIHKEKINVNGVVYASSVFINSQVEHAVHASCECVSLLIDPKTRLGRNIAERMNHQSIAACPFVDQLMMPSSLAYSMDNRIEKTISYIDHHIQEDLSIDHLAHQVHLSSTRFRHLFKDEMGIAVVRYLMWRKLILAAKDIFQNELTITQGAYKYGFSDDAHFSRLFKKTFGINLKRLLMNNIE